MKAILDDYMKKKLLPIKKSSGWIIQWKVCIAVVFMMLFSTAEAHHVLGRPAYSLNEDSNTPPSMAIETQIGDYFVTYMIFPAFPKPKEPGRINLYATRIDNGQAFIGDVTFIVENDDWLRSSKMELLGAQQIDDGVYRQGFEFSEQGSFIIRAKFEENGEPYEIDFPIQIGQASAMGPIGFTVALILLALFSVNVFQRRRINKYKAIKGREVL